MRKNVCKTCAHFRQHYTFDQRRIFRVHCGHCTFSKAKRRLPDAKSCENYIFADPDEAAFATKEYLSKELVEYMLKLELLPEIKDSEDEYC